MTDLLPPDVATNTLANFSAKNLAHVPLGYLLLLLSLVGHTVFSVLGRLYTGVAAGGGVQRIVRSIYFGSATVTPALAGEPVNVTVKPAAAGTSPGFVLRRWMVLLAVASLLTLAGVTLLITGCAGTPADRVALNVTGTQVVSVDAAMQAWRDYVLQGLATQEQVDRVHVLYDSYYAAGLTEKAAWLAYAQNSTNGPTWQRATASLIAAEGPLINFITSVLPASSAAKLKGTN
jgi:hypothetical protein